MRGLVMSNADGTREGPRRSPARPLSSGRQELGDEVVRQFLEGGNVRVGVLDRVGDRKRPLFFPSRCHEHAAVHHVEPRQIGQLAIVVCLKRRVVGDLARREGDAPFELMPTVYPGRLYFSSTASQPAISRSLSMSRCA